MPGRKERIKFAGAVFRVGVVERKRHGVPSPSQSGGVGKSDTSRSSLTASSSARSQVCQRREEVGMNIYRFFYFILFYFFLYMIKDIRVRHLGALAGFDVGIFSPAKAPVGHQLS